MKVVIKSVEEFQGHKQTIYGLVKEILRSCADTKLRWLREYEACIEMTAAQKNQIEEVVNMSWAGYKVKKYTFSEWNIKL